MAQKVKPTAYRLGLTVGWNSRWFPGKNAALFLEEDQLIRDLIKKEMKEALISSIVIERSGDNIRIIIEAQKPGLIIGKGGKDIEIFKNKLQKSIKKFRKEHNLSQTVSLNIDIEELKRYDISAVVVAQQLAADIEKRIPYRKVMKKGLSMIMQTRGVLGAKIKMGGRLNGAEIARSDFLVEGKMPLSSLRANIDYGEATAFNTYGTVGIKVWIYKGDIFKEKEEKKINL